VHESHPTATAAGWLLADLLAYTTDPQEMHVSHIEHDQKAPPRKPGLFATLRALRCSRADGAKAAIVAPAHRIAARAAAFCTAACVSLCAAAALLATPALALSEPCRNESLRGGPSAALPDCRAYEQVTPVDKDGTNPTGGPSFVQATPWGDGITFFTESGVPGGVGAGEFPFYLSSLGAAGWSTQGLLPTPAAGTVESVLGWSEDLTQVAVSARLLGSEHYGLFLRDTATGANQLIAEASEAVELEPRIDDFTPDGSRVIFENEGQLLPAAVPGRMNLYEWNNETHVLSLAGILPAGEGGAAPAEGSFAGSYESTKNNTAHASGEVDYTQDTISTEGSRVFFTAAGSGQLYVRENGVETARVSASRRSVPDPNGPKPAAFMAATPDGSQVFFASCEKLRNESTAVSAPGSLCGSPGSPPQGQDLYRYDVTGGALTDLTVDANLADSLGADVQGVLGVSNDGSYVYFVANGMIPGSGATEPGSCRGGGFEGTCNLYLWHDGETKFITQLDAAGGNENSDAINWEPEFQLGSLKIERTSRVTPEGQTLLFRSQLQLTGYDNRSSACVETLDPEGRCSELYRFQATGGTASGSFTCVSCDPSGAVPAGAATLQSMQSAFGSPSATTPPALTRNLSAGGGRIFFETSDPLLSDPLLPPQDTNERQDVYEWEAPATGSCSTSAPTYSVQDGGCLYLISTGTSTANSYFADADVSGENVFFFTESPLVGQDKDQLVDIYDARVDGGLASQSPPAPVICEAEGCKPALHEPPAEVAPATPYFDGPANPVTTPVVVKVETKPKPLTRAQKLAKALRACQKGQRRKRAACRAVAEKRFGGRTKARKTSKASKSNGGGGK
jgi:hypothetical protein